MYLLSKRLLIVTALLALWLSGCSEEQQNRIGRAAVTWLEGDYRVTYADGEHSKSWIVRSGKVTSEPEKGYYYFWSRDNGGKKVYVQTPIGRTYIEELTE
ncbi:hypothetical protein D5085_03710 [Ectothiorhodospiraceae bacterium BW-2]|nr:hypothetical protein D5085_03710 [Ectothiorhodospiraceae bacterium BW-2]